MSTQLIDRLKDCGMNWGQVSPQQFTASWQDTNGYWEVYLTKMNEDVYIVDFKKDSNHFISISSVDDENVKDLYEELIFEGGKFRSIQNIGQVQGCKYGIYDEIMIGGIFANGSANS